MALSSKPCLHPCQSLSNLQPRSPTSSLCWSNWSLSAGSVLLTPGGRQRSQGPSAGLRAEALFDVFKSLRTLFTAKGATKRKKDTLQEASEQEVYRSLKEQSLEQAEEQPVKGLQLRLDNVKKAYKERVVVNGVTITVQEGEVVGLLGPNGAGKSTTFSMAVGLERPTEGRICLGDMDITSLPLERRARLGMGYLTQESSVFKGLSVANNIRLILQETGVPRKLQEERLQELLEEFRLVHVKDTIGRLLSGGERRRTELARALASNCAGGPPHILLVDEPFAGVDPIGVAEIQQYLMRLCKERNMGILITDHNVYETLEICDRAYMVHRGQVMASGLPEELYNDDYVKKHYLGEGFRQSWKLKQ